MKTIASFEEKLIPNDFIFRMNEILTSDYLFERNILRCKKEEIRLRSDTKVEPLVSDITSKQII